MNTPGKAEGNWTWRAPQGALSLGGAAEQSALAALAGQSGQNARALAEELRAQCELYGRTPLDEAGEADGAGAPKAAGKD